MAFARSKQGLNKELIYAAFTVMLIDIFFGSCVDRSNSQHQPITNTKTSTTEISIDLQQTLKQRKSIKVNVLHDEYFNSSKEYLGYEILPIIDSAIKASSYDTTKAVVIFECTDGYKPTMPLAKLYGTAKPFVVYKDLSEKGENNWPDSVQNKFKPYYLVWDSVAKEDDSFSWPYGLIRITLSWTDIEDRLIYPANNLSLIRGFNLFHSNCMKCHALNGVGGSMAPEFNVPKNITEYWRSEDIIAFAKNSKSYRKNSKMPPITNLDDQDFKEIISYLKYMKDYKVSNKQ